jgi:hypothetical protein
MVSDSAKKGLDLLLTKAVKNHIGMQESDVIQVNLIPMQKRTALPESKFYILTVANFFFKVLVIFHINDDEKSRAYFSKPDSGLGCDEVFPEVCNLCCGAFNRELGLYFPHLGMSTPYLLEKECLDFVDLLRPVHMSQFKTDINGNFQLHTSLYVCAYRPLDFRFDPDRLIAVPAEETGVLELF